MKSATVVLLIGQLVFLFACAGQTKNGESDLDDVKKLLAVKQNAQELKKEKTQPFAGKTLDEFIINGYSILDTTRGDLNLDDYSDIVLVAKKQQRR